MSGMLNPGYYDERDLAGEGFRSLGRNVKISKQCTIVGAHNISIGDNVRIDAYCSIIVPDGGELRLGSFIHIGGYCLLSAGSGIVMEDFVGVSQGSRIYSRSDDYSGEHLTGPTVPEKYTGVVQGPVVLRKHVIVGSGTVILPRVTIGEGTSVGALTLVTRDLAEWGVYVGMPARRVKERSRRLLELEAQLRAELQHGSSEDTVGG